MSPRMRTGGSKKSVKSDKLSKDIEELSSAEISVLQAEFIKVPNHSHYYRKKFSSRLSEQLSVPEKLIQTWMKVSGDVSRQSKEVGSTEPDPTTETATSDFVVQSTSPRTSDDETIEKQSSQSSQPPGTMFKHVKIEDVERETDQEGLMIMRKECEELRSELRKKIEFCENLKSMYYNCKEKTLKFTKNVKNYSIEKEEELNEIRDKLSEKEKEIKELQASESRHKSETNLDISRLEKQIKDKNSTITELEQKLKSKEELLKDDKNGKKHLQNRLDQCAKNFRETLQLKQEKEEEMRKKISLLKEDVTKEVEEKDLLKKSYEELDKLLNDNRVYIQKLENSNSQLQKEKQLLGQTALELNKKISSLEKTIDFKETEMHKSLEKQKAKDEKVSAMEDKVQAAHEKQKQLELKLKEKEETVRMKMSQIRDLEEHEDSLQHRLRVLENQLAETTRAKLKLEEKCKTMKLQGKSDLVDAQAVISKSKKDIIEKHSTIEQLKTSLKNVDEIVGKKVQEIFDLKEDVLVKTHELGSKEEEIVKLKKTLTNKETEMELIFAKFQEKDGELLEKEEAVEKLKSKIIDLNDGFERELEAKNSEKIKMHHKLIELQMQQQGLESSRDNSENCIRELQAMAKLEVEEKLSLIEKLDDQRILLDEMKRALLHRDSQGRGATREVEVSYKLPLLQPPLKLDPPPTEALQSPVKLDPTPNEALQSPVERNGLTPAEKMLEYSCPDPVGVLRGSKRSCDPDPDDVSPAKKSRTTETSQIIYDLLLDLIIDIIR